MHTKWLSYHRHVFICCILVLNIITLSRESEQSSAINFFPKIASSPPRLRLLAKNEDIIYILIKDFYTAYRPKDRLLKAPTEELLKLIHSYLENFEATTGQLKLKLERQNEKTNYRAMKVAWNPVTTYLMFQRFLKPLREILVGLSSAGEAEFALKKQIDFIMEISAWPTEMDLQFAINSILRIQYVYDLSTYDLSVGKIAGYETNVNLSGLDCVEIGKQALLLGNDEPYESLAVEWLGLGRRKLERQSRLHTTETTYGTISRAETEHYITNAIALSQDNPFSGPSMPLVDHWYKSKKSETNRDDPFEEAATQVRKRTSALQAWKGSTHANFNLVNYWRTCAGENYKSEYEKSKLFCWYETEVNSVFKINPLKAELLSFKPLLVIQYYDLIGDKMIEKIKRDSSFRLRHSAANNNDNNRVQIVSSIRSSSSSGIMDHEREEFFPIADIIEAVTGLNVRNSSSSEQLHPNAYTTGGHFTIHKDAIGYSTDLPTGEGYGFIDRIATFMLYLTDVEKGGGTSFPQSGIASTPIKGSALLWYNLLRNGTTDEYTYHGGCPVIIGEKWIANKWIRSKDQMFLEDYQCVPDQTARFMIRVNGKDLVDFF